MIKQHTQKGFTLVELAIVLTVIGLLIGGILKGQQMIMNGRIVATIAQINAIEAATTTFRDTYDALPGDMLLADQKISGCTQTCSNAPLGADAGDGHVGWHGFNTNWHMQQRQGFTLAPNAPIANPAGETILFWVELSKAGLLKGVNDDGINNLPVSFGGSHPAAPVGGGFIVGDGSEDNINPFTGQSLDALWAAIFSGRPCIVSGPGACSGSAFQMGGSTVIGLNTTVDPAVTATSNLFRFGAANSGTLVLTPSQAAQFDRKMDDGSPFTGFVEAFGWTSGILQPSLHCYDTTTGVPTGVYRESVNIKNCGLFFRVQ